MKPIRPRRAACVYGKAEGPFHPKGPAGGWCGTGSGELWIFLPRNRIICQVENSLYLDRGSAMNASLPNCIVKLGGPPDALEARLRNAVRRRPKCSRKGAAKAEKFGRRQRTFGSLVTLCNPTKPPKISLEK